MYPREVLIQLVVVINQPAVIAAYYEEDPHEKTSLTHFYRIGLTYFNPDWN